MTETNILVDLGPNWQILSADTVTDTVTNTETAFQGRICQAFFSILIEPINHIFFEKLDTF